MLLSEDRSDGVDRVSEGSCGDDSHEEHVDDFLVRLRGDVSVSDCDHRDEWEVETVEILSFPRRVIYLFVFEPAVLIVLQLNLSEEGEAAATKMTYRDDEKDKLE